ncbi:MAG: pectinesterase family protein [Candidatus Gastranaerophilales bacterium]|nr:pectinesterase family protein [Candidatus Gastranaerophilales bacterium]
MTENTIHLYVNISGQDPCYGSIGEALAAVDGGLSSSVSKPEDRAGLDEASRSAAQSFPAKYSDLPPVILHIGEGIYREKLVITRPNVTLLGAGCDKTRLVYGQGAKELLPDGSNRGTFRTASVRIATHDFTAKHLTFQNDAGFGHTVGQALALYVDGDRIVFEDCVMLGSQDTLFTAPLPQKEAKPGGFTGPGESAPRVMGRHYFKDCLLRGDVDFIFGGAIAYFEDCVIFSQLPGDRTPPESPDDHSIYGYVTAASTFKDQPFGYVFQDCHLVSDCPPASVYLGRPWREWAKTVFLHCELGEHIHPLGWHDWNKEHGHFYYGEYDSYGPGANPEKRASFSHQLTEEEAAKYTIENVLQGWNPADTI